MLDVIVASIATIVLAVLAALFGTKYHKAMKKLPLVVSLLNEVIEAAKDHQITSDEAKRIRERVESLIKDC